MTLSAPGFELLLEDGPCMVVGKPGGLLTQAPPGIDSLEVRIKQFLKLRDDKPGKVYLAMTHRLDRPVSGALVAAKHVRAAKRICRQFQLRTVRKVYWACVEGCVAEDQGQWQDHVRKLPGRPRAEIVPASHPEARLARLQYQVLQRRADHTLLQIELETGRMHQIRIQASHHGHPVLGDDFYGARLTFGPAVDNYRENWIALHGRRVALEHPMTRQPVDVTAPIPCWWEDYAPPAP